MAVSYKHKCYKCKKNYVLITSRQTYIICYDCQKSSLQGKITDPKYKKLFNIPEDYYKDNIFLRNIKGNYLKYGNITEAQETTFQKVVARIRSEKRA